MYYLFTHFRTDMLTQIKIRAIMKKIQSKNIRVAAFVTASVSADGELLLNENLYGCGVYSASRCKDLS